MATCATEVANSRWDITTALAIWTGTHRSRSAQNKIVKLFDDDSEVSKKGGLSGAEIILKKGGTMGDIYMTTDFLRDNEGNIATDNTGSVLQRNLDNPQ